MAKKLSSDEKKIQALLLENGGLTILQNNLLKAIKAHPSKEDVFDLLEKVLVSVAEFQDIHHSKMDELKKIFKSNEKIMLHLGPLHNAIKKCGRGIWKSEKHKSFVRNKAGIAKKKSILQKVVYENVTSSRIFLENDHYDTAQPLSFLKSSRATGVINRAMIEDLKPRVEFFIEENFNKINCEIEDLRRLFQ